MMTLMTISMMLKHKYNGVGYEPNWELITKRTLMNIRPQHPKVFLPWHGVFLVHTLQHPLCFFKLVIIDGDGDGEIRKGC